MKAGGLADVAAALPDALAGLELPLDIRLLVPGYEPVLDALGTKRTVAQIGPVLGAGRLRLVSGRLPGQTARVYAIDAPSQYRGRGDPYVGPDGSDWPDNLQRFALLSRVAAYLAVGDLDEHWRADVVHLHDWHAALAGAYLQSVAAHRIARVFTIHNLAFQGRYPLARFGELGLPASFATPEGIEFFGELNCMKAGLLFAERLTTVSSTYAREIQTPAFGHGLDGLLRSRAGVLTGIANGVDYARWNPATDRELAATYDADHLDGKRECKRALLRHFGLAPALQAPLFGVVSRLTDQKGIDWVAGTIDHLVRRGAQLVVLGTGARPLEQMLTQAMQRHPQHVAVHLGYDEALAHRVYAGCDVMLVPSRFEPCGLTQMYALAYGTLPLVRATGGLADTVVDAGPPEAGGADGTGFVFRGESAAALAECVDRALAWWEHPDAWRALQRRAMRRRFTWEAAARQYAALYRSLA
jgi:starch synthase